MENNGQKITDSDKNERLIWSGDCRGHEHFPIRNVCRLKSMQSIIRIPKWNKNLMCLLSCILCLFLFVFLISKVKNIFNTFFFLWVIYTPVRRLCHCHTRTASWNKERKETEKTKTTHFSRRKLRASFTQRALNREHFVRFTLGNDLTVFVFFHWRQGGDRCWRPGQERELFRSWNHSRNAKK